MPINTYTPIVFIEDQPNRSSQLFVQLIDITMDLARRKANKINIDIRYVVPTIKLSFAKYDTAMRKMEKKYDDAKKGWGAELENHVIFSSDKSCLIPLDENIYDSEENTQKHAREIYTRISDENAVVLMDLALNQISDDNREDENRLLGATDPQYLLSHVLCEILEDTGVYFQLYTNYGIGTTFEENWLKVYEQRKMQKNRAFNTPTVYYRARIDGYMYTDETFYNNFLKT